MLNLYFCCLLVFGGYTGCWYIVVVTTVVVGSVPHFKTQLTGYKLPSPLGNSAAEDIARGSVWTSCGRGSSSLTFSIQQRWRCVSLQRACHLLSPGGPDSPQGKLQRQQSQASRRHENALGFLLASLRGGTTSLKWKSWSLWWIVTWRNWNGNALTKPRQVALRTAYRCATTGRKGMQWNDAVTQTNWNYEAN